MSLHLSKCYIVGKSRVMAQLVDSLGQWSELEHKQTARGVEILCSTCLNWSHLIQDKYDTCPGTSI